MRELPTNPPRPTKPGRFFLILFLGLTWIGNAALADELPDTRDPQDFFFAQTFGDLPEELADARKAGKLGLFLFYEQEGCQYCLKMKQSVLNQRRVQDWYREHFVNIPIDIRGDVELRDVDGITLPSKVFAQHRKVEYTPVMSFLDLHGIEVFRKTGLITSPEEFMLMGRYIREERYTDTSFSDFLAEVGFRDADPGLTTPATEP
jgi:thioredoxin-related protein